MIDSKFQPARLYIKECAGIKYFGKSTKENVEAYTGSGVIWQKRIKKYGKSSVKTLWVSDWYTDRDEIQKVALQFSKDNNIVESPQWANLIPENGLDGHSSDAAKILNGTPEKRKQTSKRTEGQKNPRYDPTIYSFTHVDGTTVEITKLEFRKLCPLISTGELAKIISGKHKSVHGWRLTSTPIEETGKASGGKKAIDKNVYHFYHSSGITEICDRQTLIKKYNLNPTHVSTMIKTNGKSYPHKGWTIKIFTEENCDK
jgi:hypothetical protein